METITNFFLAVLACIGFGIGVMSYVPHNYYEHPVLFGTYATGNQVISYALQSRVSATVVDFEIPAAAVVASDERYVLRQLLRITKEEQVVLARFYTESGHLYATVDRLQNNIALQGLSGETKNVPISTI